MSSLSKIRPIELLALTILIGSCSGLSFDPDYALPNLEHEVLVHEDASTVSFHSREMLEYACMHKDKVRELAELLVDAKLKKQSTDLLKIYRDITNNAKDSGI